jgi:hypothetical protein
LSFWVSSVNGTLRKNLYWPRNTHDQILASQPTPFLRFATLRPTAFERGRSSCFATVDAATAVEQHLNALEARELPGEHSERAQPTALHDE